MITSRDRARGAADERTNADATIAAPYWSRPDWSRPWLQPYRRAGLPLTRRLRQAWSLQHALAATGAGTALRFVPQQALPPGVAYEAFVHAHGAVPVREGLHDFFNGVVWLHFPKTKARLNALHAAELARRGPGPDRGPLRDALTMFDENGALLLAPRGMWEALRARDWRGLFVTRRALWDEARVIVFGHGLLEQLQQPRKPLTAHVLAAPQALRTMAEIDDWLATTVGEAWAAKPFAPMPVLGVPGWCAGNAHESFYDDAPVFRHARRSDPRQQRTLQGAA